VNNPSIFPFGSKREFVTVLVVSADTGDTVTIYRQYGSKAAEVVRGSENVPMSNDEQVFIDYEVPQGYVITYWVVAKSGTETAESVHKPVGPYDFGRDVVFDLGDPKRGMRIYVENFNQSKYGISRDVQRVWGRPDPVVISGVREFPSGTLNLITVTLEERQNLLDIINAGSTIAFAPQKPVYGLDGVLYFAVGDVAENRVTDRAAETSRRWALDVQQVTPPPATYQYPDYGKNWREFSADLWRVQATHQWWEAIA
jgi:hypothetical protein